MEPLMSTPERIDLTGSEAAVLQAASRLLAAHVVAGDVTADNLEEVTDAAARAAVSLARKIDRMVSADEEVTTRLDSPSTFRPLG